MFEFNKVKLVSYSKFADQDYDLLDQVAFCARVSNPTSQMKNMKNDKLCGYLLDNKHFSPFEMSNIVLEIETTRDISRQILRHRSFSFQEFSGRYADATTELGFTTRECRLQHPKNRQMSVDIIDEEGDTSELKEKFIEIQNELIEKEKELYKFCIDNNIAKEQSRVLLSEGLIKTKIYMNGTLRSWIHYIQLRSDISTTQREHYDIAVKCAEEISKVFPLIKKFLV